MAVWTGCRHQFCKKRKKVQMTNLHRLHWLKPHAVRLDDHKHDILPVQTCQSWIGLTALSASCVTRRAGAAEKSPSYLLCFFSSPWHLCAWKLEYLSGAVEKPSLRVPQQAKKTKKMLPKSSGTTQFQNLDEGTEPPSVFIQIKGTARPHHFDQVHFAMSISLRTINALIALTVHK